MSIVDFFCFFFFSSRRRHTRWTGDWSSDVCSSSISVLGHAGFARRPVSVQMSRLTTPLGTGKSWGGRFFVAASITSTQTGRAAAAPVMPGPIFCLRSNPTQTPVTTPDPHPLVGEDAVGGDQLEQVHLRGPEGEGEVGREAALDPHPPRVGGHDRGPQLLQ